MPYAKLFRSRWSALIWAAGIVWTALDIAGSSPQAPVTNAAGREASTAEPADATGEAVDNDDLAILAGVANGN